MKTIIFLISLVGYLFFEMIRPVLNFIKNNIVTILVVLFLIILFAFPGLSKYSDESFIFFSKIICFSYLIFKLLIVEINKYDNYNIDNQYCVKDENYYKELEEFHYNGLTKDEIDRRKKKIRKNLGKKLICIWILLM